MFGNKFMLGPRNLKGVVLFLTPVLMLWGSSHFDGHVWIWVIVLSDVARSFGVICASIASESRETESRPEASSHGYWIHQLDTRKTAHVNFTYVWPTLLRKLNHKYESFYANIMNISRFSHHISTCECVEENLQSPSLSRWLSLHRIDNVIHHLRNKMRHERFCTIKGIQYYGCAYKSEINHWCSASNFSLL